MKKTTQTLFFSGLLAMILVTLSIPSWAASQPGQPQYGYGSSEHYISSSHREKRTGPWYNPWGGVWCWYYTPSTLKYGNKAPVVILLHGFMLMAPDIYDDTIRHFTRQGYIVLYPQINKGGVIGLATDTDQNKMFSRAVDSVNDALGALGSKVARDEIYIFGHSLGGLIGSVWMSDPDAPDVAGIVLANPQTDHTQGIPSFVQSLVSIKPIDWRSKVKYTTAPVMILSGSSDDLAPTSQAIGLANELTQAAGVRVYQAKTDKYGSPDINADHMAAINNSGLLPDFIMDILGGAADTDSLDYRYYWAAMDAMMAGDLNPGFDMGQWSDGTPVTPVETLY